MGFVLNRKFFESSLINIHFVRRLKVGVTSYRVRFLDPAQKTAISLS